MPFKVDEKGVQASRPLDSGELFIFSAENIRKERTGVHARVSILQDGQLLSYDTFNVERDRERSQLTKSAHGRLGDVLGKAYTQPMLRLDLDAFCAGLWERWQSRYRAEMIGGDPDLGPPRFVLTPYVMEGGGTILFGPPGRGKSYLALLMAVSIDAGCSHLWPVEQAPVLCINLERSALSIRRRITHVNCTLGLEPTRPLRFLNARGRALADVIEAAREIVARDGIRVIFVDSLSRAGFGDLTDNGPVNTIMDALNGLCETWVALGHTPRSDESHLYGSMMFDAAADVMVQLLAERREDGTLGIGLQVTKANDMPIPPLRRLALEFDQYGLSNVREAGHHEFPELEAGRRMSVADEVAEYLLSVGKDTATEIAKATGRTREKVSGVLQGERFVRVGREGNSVFYGMKTGVYPPPDGSRS